MTIPASSMSRPKHAPGRRWHDLDALRAFAMVLGIGLHAALSFFPTAWPVQDVTASSDGIFDEFVLAVHGFRMPLFFLLSGFFAALLWRRRGLGSLLGHRMKRVVVPFVLGVILIAPTVGWVSDRAIEGQIADARDIHSAVFLGNLGATRALLTDGVDADAPAEDGYAPIYLAAVTGNAEMVALLLEHGAEPNVPSAEGFPIDVAAYFGHEDAAEALIRGGARDPRSSGQGWEELPYWGLGVVEDVVPDAESGLDAWLPDFYHLWFLWLLILFVLVFAPVAWLVDWRAARRDRTAAPSRWPRIVMWALVPLVLLPQRAMEGGETIPAFGPDTSIGWVPIPHVFAYYLIFFAFGALMYGRTGRSGALVVDTVGRRWRFILPVALVVFLAGLEITFGSGEEAGWIASALQVGYAWLMIFGLMGLFRALLSGEHRAVRYLSDASYWMYLIHLTLVIALQAWVRTWDIPAAVKFLLIVATTVAILLITYQSFVRYTPIGTMLNGKRTRPSKAHGSPADASGQPVSPARSPEHD